MPEAAKVQIDPQTAADLAQLASDLAHNPETRREFGKLVKKAVPNTRHAAAFADLDADDKFEAFKNEQEQKEIKRQQEQILARMNQQRSSLLTGGPDGTGRKYDEDAVKKIEALMEKKGLTDYDDAAVLYAATLPPENTLPSPDIPKHGATWEFPEFATFGKDPVGAARNTAHQVIAEFARKQR